MGRKAWLPVVRDAAAIGLADGIFGISFGALAIQARLSVPEAALLSVLAFTGASQFALVAVVAQGGSPLVGLASAVLLGVRNALYGLRIRRLLPRRWWPLRAQFVIDETVGMALAQSEAPLRQAAFVATAASVFAFWNAGTLVGALAGLRLGNPARFGLDAAGPAVFLALAASLVKGRAELAAAVLAGAFTLVAALFLPPGIPILVAAGLATTIVAIAAR